MEGSEEILNFENRTIENTCLNVNWKKKCRVSGMGYYFKDLIFMLCPEGEEKMGEVENILEIMSENPQIGKR